MGKKRTSENKLNNAYALYRRVSSDKQVKEGESLEVQLSLAEQYIKKSGENVELFDYCEPGISGSKVHFTKRPELMKMLEDAQRGLFKTVLVFRRDRLDRQQDFFTIKYILTKAGVNIVYLDPSEVNVDENDIYGPLIESVITSIAAIEPKIISARVKAVFREKSLKGEWKTGKPPYGLFYDKENSKLRQIKEEADIVKKVFQYYVNEKLGYRKIAMRLNDEGILFRNHLNERKSWTISIIRGIINNPIYKGFIKLNNEDGNIELVTAKEIEEPIIPEQLFDKANNIKQNRSNFSIKPREITTSYLLSGILFCKCGHPMRGVDKSYNYTNKEGERIKKKYTYYFCDLYLQGNYKGLCNFKSINANQIHKIVLEKCCDLFHPDNYEDTRVYLMEKQVLELKETKVKIKELSRKISELKRKIDVLLENLESSTETHLVATYESRITKRTEELKVIQTKLIEQKEYSGFLKHKVWSIKDISNKLRDWRLTIYKVPPEIQRKMVLDVIESICIDEEGELSINLKLDINVLESIKKEKGTHNNSYVYLFPLIYYLRKNITFDIVSESIIILYSN